MRRSCAWLAWRRSLLSNLQSRSRSHRRQRAATLLSASVSSSTKNSLRSTSALRAETSLSQSRRTARTRYSTMHTCHRRVRGSTHLNLLPADPRRSLHRPLCRRPRAPSENGLRLRRHRSIRSRRPTMIAAPRSMILLRVRSTCRTDAGWKRIRALAAIWTMLAMCT